MKNLVKKGLFREDLYYRLSVLPIKMPSLRERIEDIDELLEYYKVKFDVEFDFTEEAKSLLYEHDWPGNIRELRNCIEFWANLDRNTITKSDIPFLDEINNNDKNFSEEQKYKNKKFENFIEISTNFFEEVVFLLNELNIAYVQKRRIGRKTLHHRAKKEGFLLSEQRVRDILLQMENYNYVNILKGRGGTIITPKGVEALNYFIGIK